METCISSLWLSVHPLLQIAECETCLLRLCAKQCCKISREDFLNMSCRSDLGKKTKQNRMLSRYKKKPITGGSGSFQLRSTCPSDSLWSQHDSLPWGILGHESSQDPVLPLVFSIGWLHVLKTTNPFRFVKDAKIAHLGSKNQFLFHILVCVLPMFQPSHQTLLILLF